MSALAVLNKNESFRDILICCGKQLEIIPHPLTLLFPLIFQLIWSVLTSTNQPKKKKKQLVLKINNNNNNHNHDNWEMPEIYMEDKKVHIKISNRFAIPEIK